MNWRSNRSEAIPKSTICAMYILKIKILLCASLILCSSSLAQSITLDQTFGRQGIAIIDEGGEQNSRAEDILIQPDGRLLLCGSDGPDAAVTRLDETGSPDPTFGTNGTFRLDLGGVADRFNDVLLLPDGSIMATGYQSASGGVGPWFTLIRLRSNGTLDETFGTNGLVRETPQDIASADAIIRQNDGRIIVSGFYTANPYAQNFSAIRYLPNGERDISFGTNGRSAFPFPVGSSHALALDSQGRIVTAGYSGFPSKARTTLTSRLNSDGTLDESFGNRGVAAGSTIEGLSDFFVPRSVQIDASGNIYIPAGYRSIFGGFDNMAILKYNSDGSPDTSFSGNGLASVQNLETSGIVYDIALQSDGKIIVVGRTGPFQSGSLTIARLTAAGATDTSFGTGGSERVRISENASAQALVFEPGGRLTVAGWAGSSDQTLTKAVVARFLTDGRPTANTAAVTPAAFAFSTAPNPFNGSTTVRVSLSTSDEVRVSAYDALGRRIAVLHEGFLPAGEQTFRFDAERLPGGLYMLRAEGRTGSAAVRVVRQ